MGRKQKLKEERRNDGRAFEAFVKRVHEVLEPTGALVEQNAKVKDVDTGQDRDVDVWIRQWLNDRETRTMIECRDRTRQQDVMWIEQLMGKRISVGADAVIAVTKRPLSNPAQIKAGKRDIQVRCLRELGDTEILAIVETGIPGVRAEIRNVGLTADADHGEPTTLVLTFVDVVADAERDDTVLEPLRRDKLRAAFVFDEAGASGLSIDEILGLARSRGWDPTSGGKLGEDVETVIRLVLDRQRAGLPDAASRPLFDVVLDRKLFAPTKGGRMQLASIEIGYRAFRRLDPVKLDRHAYDGTPSPTRILSGTWAPAEGTGFKFTFALDGRGLRGRAKPIELP